MANVGDKRTRTKVGDTIEPLERHMLPFQVLKEFDQVDIEYTVDCWGSPIKLRVRGGDYLGKAIMEMMEIYYAVETKYNEIVANYNKIVIEHGLLLRQSIDKDTAIAQLKRERKSKQVEEIKPLDV